MHTILKYKHLRYHNYCIIIQSPVSKYDGPLFQGSTSSWSGATANGNKKSTEEGEMVSCANLFISLRSQCPEINCSTFDWIKSWWNLKESASGFYSCPKPYNQSFHSILCILWNWNAREMEYVWNILIVDGYDGEWGGGGWDRLKKS